MEDRYVIAAELWNRVQRERAVKGQLAGYHVVLTPEEADELRALLPQNAADIDENDPLRQLQICVLVSGAEHKFPDGWAVRNVKGKVKVTAP